VFSTQPFIEMATVLPYGVLVISKSPRPNFADCAGEVECELEAISKVKKRRLMNKRMASAS